MKRGEKTITAMLILTLLIGLAGGALSYYRYLETPPVYTPPPVKMPSPNAFQDFLAAGKLLEANGGISDALSDGLRGKGPLSIAQARQTVDINRKVLARVRKGFAKTCRVPPGYEMSSDLYLRYFKYLSYLLTLEGILYEREGRWADAAGSFTDSIRLSVEMSHGGESIHKRAEASIQYTALLYLSPGVDHLSTEDARRLGLRLESLDRSREPIARIAENQRINLLKLWADDMQKEWTLDILKGCGLLEKAHFFQEFRGKRHVFLLGDGYMTKQIAAVRKPYYQYSNPPLLQISFAELPALDVESAYARHTLSEARLKILYTSLALKAYRLRNGAYPSSLNSLIPAYLKAVPKDPCSAKPLVYRNKNRCYILYSIGLDFRDNGGKLVRMEPNKPYRNPPGEGDITLEWYLGNLWQI